jgi:hypothetical protein
VRFSLRRNGSFVGFVSEGVFSAYRGSLAAIVTVDERKDGGLGCQLGNERDLELRVAVDGKVGFFGLTLIG